MTSLWPSILEKLCNVPSKSNKQKNLASWVSGTKITGFGSIGQRHGSVGSGSIGITTSRFHKTGFDTDPDPTSHFDPDPDSTASPQVLHMLETLKTDFSFYSHRCQSTLFYPSVISVTTVYIIFQKSSSLVSFTFDWNGYGLDPTGPGCRPAKRCRSDRIRIHNTGRWDARNERVTGSGVTLKADLQITRLLVLWIRTDLWFLSGSYFSGRSGSGSRSGSYPLNRAN